MRTLAGQYPRYGYRTIRIFLDREGHVMSADRMYRLWRQERCRCRRNGHVDAWPPAVLGRCHRRRSNHVWAYDFVFDTCADGQQLKCLTVIDEFTRECLAIDVAGGIRSGRVIEVLTQLVSVHGAPRYLRSDNGPEFVARRDPPVVARRPASRRRSSTRGSRGRMAPTNRSTASSATSICRCNGSGIALDAKVEHRRVAAALQRGAAPFQPRVFDAAGIQSDRCRLSFCGALAGFAGSR